MQDVYSTYTEDEWSSLHGHALMKLVITKHLTL